MIETITKIPIFSSLGKREIRFLLDIAGEVEYPANTVLFQEGDPGDRLYVILEGQLEVIKKMGKTGEHLLRVSGPGEYFGEMCFVNPSGSRSASVRTRTPVRLLELKRDDFEALLYIRPEFAIAIARGVTERMLESEAKFLRALVEKDRQWKRILGKSGISKLEEKVPEQVAEDGEQHQGPGTGVPRIYIRTFGKFQVFRGEAPISEEEWKAKQPQLLLKAIICRGIEAVPKDVLVEDLWPEMSPESAENNFKVILHRLRKVLEPEAARSSYVILKKNLVSLNKDLCHIDLDEFLAMRHRAKKADEFGDARRAALCYESCIDLYRGDFLSKDLYAPWAELKRDELRGMYIDLLYRAAELHEIRGNSRKATGFYKLIITADPSREEAYQKLMLIYANRGMRSEALKLYEECRKALQEQVGAEPCSLTTSIYRKIVESPS